MIKDNDSPRSAGRPTSLKYTCRCANMPGAYSEPLPGKQPRTRGGHERQGTQRGPAGRWREGRCRGRGPHGDHPPPPELGGGVADRLLLSAPAGDRSSARGSLHVRFSCSDGPTAPPGSPWVGTVLAGEPAARTGPARPRRPSGKARLSLTPTPRSTARPIRAQTQAGTPACRGSAGFHASSTGCRAAAGRPRGGPPTPGPANGPHPSRGPPGNKVQVACSGKVLHSAR